MRYVNGTRLDDRIIRTDWDAGFKEGRQYGRGKTGGQVGSAVKDLPPKPSYYQGCQRTAEICFFAPKY